MAFLDALAHLVRTVLRLVLWAVAGLLALTLLSLALLFFLSWLLIGLALGRKPQVSLRARVQRMREFSGGFGPAGFKAGGFWQAPVRKSEEEAGSATSSLAGRLRAPGPVQDVEVKETRPRSGD